MFVRKNVRKLLIQSYFIPFIPIIVQPKTKVCKRQRDVRNFIKKVRKLKLSLYDNEVLHDLKPDNLGWFNGTLYKIDYDASYRLYNFLIEIRNKLKIIGGLYMMKKYINIANVSKYANNEWILSGAINTSMIGGFTMFASYLYGVCIGVLFMELSCLIRL